ncbi:hypothetical protein HNP84_010155 [Thermocatellispora tengchongensis]|uniref:Uncharacterized protein n=1 Tax=Thermocatellispora tengchongensis TaxID=1073253 RepID=A0A840PLK7_9ACTN|nr:hypothetical protein [Thermocatellispora tengchongensis]MBB5140388.1 hypothetical protein [Thermocatellispora tengchongensis]
MRTYFEPDEDEEFEAAKDLLVRRCLDWAGERGLPADGLVLAAALDSRHRSRDGRLAFWNAEQVRRFLLEWIPQYVVAPRDVLDAAPRSLVTLLRYLAATGLRDPRGASVEELSAVVGETVAEYPAALDDPARQGIAKFWAQTALDSGVDLTRPKELARFQRDLDAGRVAYDADALDAVVEARFVGAGPDEERAYPQPPITLPPAAELAEAAGRSEIVRRLVALAEWAGADGRALTGTGNLRLADARELAELLGTGEQDLKVRSAAEMRRVNLMVTWAKNARLVRVSKGRLLRVAKAAPLLRDPERLWIRAFEVFFDLGAAIGAPASGWDVQSVLVELFDEVMPDVLNSAYGLPGWVPVVRLQESVWLACQEYFRIGAGMDHSDREQADEDLVAALEVLAELGAVELSHGVADALYSSDLGDLDPDEQPLPYEARARLLERLAEPGLLVRLTPLGMRAVRDRMLADGRDAPLVGELADAAPAELLGVLAQHYPEDEAAAELDGWLAAHGGDAGPLLDAVRACPFRTRASAMLGVLTEARPGEALSLLRDLRGDRVLGPLALIALLNAEELQQDDLTAEEQVLVMTEGLLGLLELAGPEEVISQITTTAGPNAPQIVEAMLESGHPAEVSMAELRRLVAERLRARPHRFRHMSAGSRGRRSGRRRRP